jgi:hypothetical protein
MERKKQKSSSKKEKKDKKIKMDKKPIELTKKKEFPIKQNLTNNTSQKVTFLNPSKTKKSNLFESDESEEENLKIKINQNYAQKYQQKKEKEELTHCKKNIKKKKNSFNF